MVEHNVIVIGVWSFIPISIILNLQPSKMKPFLGDISGGPNMPAISVKVGSKYACNNNFVGD